MEKEIRGIYSYEDVVDYLENDEISMEEAGFMEGYIEL